MTLHAILLLATTLWWSVFHPVDLDSTYMKRVADRAVEYGDVAGFEVCGDCHSPYGGINGLSLLEPYPTARAKVDPKRVERARADLNAVVRIAHGIGKPLIYWHREIFIPEGLLKDIPELMDGDGEFDLLGKAYEQYLRFKIDETFKHVPDLDGLVLTITEADYSVIHNSRPDHYPPLKVVERMARIFAEELERRGKMFTLRSFGSIARDYEDILAGAALAAKDHRFEIETKVTPYDFDPFLPNNPFLRGVPGTALAAECDSLGEFFGAGYLPFSQSEAIRRYVTEATRKGVDRYTVRIDRVGNSIFDSAQEANLFCYSRLIKSPDRTADDVMAEWAAKRWSGCEREMLRLSKMGYEVSTKTQCVDGHVAFHQNPVAPTFKFIKAGGIFSVFRDGSDLHLAKDLWGVLSDRPLPGRKAILAEKDEAVRLAEEGGRILDSLEGRLAADEMSRQRRAWRNALVAARTIREFVRCAVAYFDDMDARADEPIRLKAAIAQAERTIVPMMKDPAAGIGSFDLENARSAGEDLDRVYYIPFLWLCREFANEYRIERGMRRRLESDDGVFDFVIAGGIYDDNRVARAMHGAYPATKKDVVVRSAGNRIFPNGTIAVELKAPQNAKIVVELDSDGARDCTMKKAWSNGVWKVVIGKKGAEYPGVLSVSARCADEADKKVKVERRPSPDGRFEFIEARPATGRVGGALSECRLPEIRFEGISESAVCLGSDGMKPLDAVLPSCGYLAVAEPRTRKGVVLGWVSNVNGCGAFSVRRAADGAVVVTPILDYGPMPAGTPVAEPDVFVVGRFDDCRLGLEAYADVAARLHGIRLLPNRSGYCTWCSDRYGYSDRSEFPNGAGCGTEASTLKCAELAARLLRPYGFDFIQFDDQWQRGAENNGPARDFSGTRADGPYPNGFESVVRELNRRGIAAGLWFIPFGGDAKDASWQGCEPMYVKSAVAIEKNGEGNAYLNPVALARHKGDPLKTIWGGECLDMTCPAARTRLSETVRLMTYDWGFRYLKCDGIFTGFGCDLYGGYGWQDVHFRNAVFSDRTASNVQAFRKGFRTIREAAASGTFLLGCNLGTIRAMVPSFGLVDAMRIGNDNGPIDQFPERYLEGLSAGSMRYFLNGRVWWNDPDSTYVRASTPLGRARSMASWTALTDSLFEIGDWIGDLPGDRLEILRRTLAHHGNRNVRPIDLFENAIPNGWILDGGDAKVLGFFNWSTNRTLKIDWDFAYVGLDPQKTYVGYDFWEKTGVSPFSKKLTFELPPDSCRILACREVADGEVVISTSLHIASPVYGVTKGNVLTIPGEPLEVRTYSRDRGRGFAVKTIPAGSGGWVPLVEVEGDRPCGRSEKNGEE